MTNLLNKIKDEPFITCVCLLGGTWNNNLQYLINEIKNLNLKVCLYTGYKDTTLYNLDYLKIGPFIEECGGLSSNKTNQRMFNLSTGEDITYKFWK